MLSLYDKSVAIIKKGQSETGAYIASPNFPSYRFCWLRDSSFIAHAMDRAGEYASARAFFQWVGRTLERYAPKLDDIAYRLQHAVPIGKDDVLHTRFSVDGDEVTEDKEWGNFQIDGYGSWLWALAEHVRMSGDTQLVCDLKDAISISLRYLELVWQQPNYDCWEEYPEYLHMYSLASVYAGLAAVRNFADSGLLLMEVPAIDQKLTEIKNFLERYAIHQDRFVKHILPSQNGSSPQPLTASGVDASMLAAALPYGLFDPQDPRMSTTIQAIEKELHRPGGGVYRYSRDVYYGGGEWILLSAWLGWYYARVGEVDKARQLRSWIEAQATEEGYLPEQVSAHVLAPAHYKPWLEKWGPIATPLLWSHAMYIILVEAINEADKT